MIDNDIPDPDRELQTRSPDDADLGGGRPDPGHAQPGPGEHRPGIRRGLPLLQQLVRLRLLRQRRGTITVNNDPRINCPNANWNGRTTNYCNGVTADDVVAHEWGHAYTQYNSGLIYQWQPGALNESYSDIWGETIDLINDREDGTRATSTPSVLTEPARRTTTRAPRW